MEADSVAAPSSRAPYGRACISCHKVKCRCIYTPGESTCQRCQRLKKTCVQSDSIRRSNHNTQASKTARLEKKVDGLVSLLYSQQGPINTGPIEFSDLSLLSTQPRISGMRPRQQTVNDLRNQILHHVTEASIPKVLTEEYLDIFRGSFLPFFPFIHIPASTHFSDFGAEMPFLSLVIASLTTKSAAQQLSLFSIIEKIVGGSVITEHKRNLDILLGIVCYLAWFQYHKDKSYLLMWSQIAIALVFELGIHKDDSKLDPSTRTGPERSMAERRAILAVFIISNMVWVNLKQMEPMRWTPYMDDCVRILREERKTEEDLVLGFQARCHVVSKQITQSPFDCGLGAADEISPSVLAHFAKTLGLQLHDARISLPAEMQSDQIILLSLYGTEIIGKEPLLQGSETPSLMNIRRLEGLASLLTALEMWFKLFFEVPLSDWIGITFEKYAQFWHCLTLVFKLSTLDEQGWDIEEARRRIDLLEILEQFSQSFERLPETLALVDDVGPQEWAGIFRTPPIIQATKAKFAAQLFPPAALSDDFALCFADDPWMMELFDSFQDAAQ